jgi:ABC-2 type transport system ATP-binding protein
MTDDIAISVQGVFKNFHYNSNEANSVKGILTGIFKEKKDQKDIQHALKNVSFEVKKGEFFGIVGRNGSGKSTLLKMIAGIYQPSKGNIQVSGKLVPFIELGVGFNPELTGKENVYLNGALLGFSKKEISSMYNEIVEFAELEKFMNQKLKNYSSGMQVRLAFSMAVRAKADILLIDEVLAVGDANFQRKCYEYFQRIKSQGITVIFVTHDMGAVRQYCDRVALIESSKLVSVTNADLAAKNYAKLFRNDQKSKHSHIENKRWGDKRAEYKRVKAELINDNKDVCLDITLAVKNNILDPTFGYMVANASNQPIMGSNTQIEQLNIPALKKGDRLRIKWVFPNIFNEGSYNVELVLMYDSVTTVADWWEDAVAFTVTNDKRTPYIVNPKSNFTYINEDSTNERFAQ